MMSLTGFMMEVKNFTTTGYYFTLYQICGDLNTIIAWKVVGLPSAETEPSIGHIEWNMKYDVTDIEQNPHASYHVGSATLAASIGHRYEVKLVNGLPQIEDVGSGNAGVIEIFNNAWEEQGLGISLSEDLLSMQSVSGGVTATFEIPSTYYACAYTSLPCGVITPGTSALKSIEVEFPTGTNFVSISIVNQNGIETFTDPHYNYVGMSTCN